MIKPRLRFFRDLRLLRSLATNYVSGKLHQGKVQPEYAVIQPTNLCQLNCLGCWYYGFDGENKPTEWKKKQLSLEVFKQVVVDLLKIRFRRLTISGGGDPLAHPQIYEMLEFSSEHFPVELFTNLLLCKDPARLAESGISKIRLNLSAATSAIYRAFHPNQPEESFFRLLKMIEAIRDRVEIWLNFVLCEVNVFEAEAMIQLASQTTGFLNFETQRDSPQFAMTSKQRVHLKEKLPDLIQLADQLKVKHNLRGYSPFSDTPPIDDARCYAGYFTSVVRADGKVSFCNANNEYPLGNVNETRFLEIWKSTGYQMARDQLQNKAFGTFCRTCIYYPRNKAYTDQLDFLDRLR